MSGLFVLFQSAPIDATQNNVIHSNQSSNTSTFKSDNDYYDTFGQRPVAGHQELFFAC